MFSNLNYLTKNSSDEKNYEYNKKDLSGTTPALNQGNKFKKYQKKIKSNLEENASVVSGQEGFGGINFDKLDLSADGLTKQSNNVISKNDYASQQATIDNLRQQYNNTLKEYENLIAQINGSTTGYLDRVNSNNPYLGKNIIFTTGEVAYVTQQGVVKLYEKDSNGYPDILLGTVGKNGCPIGSDIPINLPWLPNYNSSGMTIPSKPPLITGTPMTKGQSCGNEGKNVFVNSLVTNPDSSYVGCYNNIPPSTEIMFIPVMGNSNQANGYAAYASSIYSNNNDFTGPWNAFDNNVNTFWHSSVGDPNSAYDNSNGTYTGTHTVSFVNSNAQSTEAKGEFLQINLPNFSPIPLTKYSIQGRQGCCGNPNGRDPNTWYILGWNASKSTWYQVDYQSNVAFNWQKKTFNIQNPQGYGAYIMLITVAGAPTATTERYCVQVATWELFTSSNYISTPKPAMNNIGKMSIDQCKTFAVNSGNKYFAIQDIDSNGNANCLISNDMAGSQMYGFAHSYKAVPVWSSNTNSGSMATVTNTGSLSVLNSSGQSIFSTPNSNAQPSNYLGCYGDGPNRAMPLYNNGSQQYNLQQCQQIAQQNGATYFGLQNSTSGTTAQCALSNNLAQTTSYGAAGNCTKISDGTWSGGGWSNAVYNTTNPSSNYFLVLGDYYMAVWRGTNPNDFQGEIWGMNFTKNMANPSFTAEKGKYGKNWISQGATLAPGDFVGSPSGYAYLIMQTDGNLVLYTNTQGDACSVSKSLGDKTVGGQNVNALYQLTTIGNKSNMGNVAYIDENAKLHAYPSDNIQYTNTYTQIKGMDSAGYDIPGAAFGNATVESCQTTCNKNQKCAGFAYSTNNVCYPKDSSMYPNGGIQINNNLDLYVRAKNPINPPIGVSSVTNNTDSVIYQNYINGGPIDKSYGLANATSVQKQQLAQLQTKMNLISSQISNLTSKFSSGTNLSENQSKNNVKGIDDYLTNLNKTNEKITNFSTNMDNILDDSDIVALQKNYDYLFWTILATGTVLVSMNIVKQ
jgi:hypothetical protein